MFARVTWAENILPSHRFISRIAKKAMAPGNAIIVRMQTVLATFHFTIVR